MNPGNCGSSLCRRQWLSAPLCVPIRSMRNVVSALNNLPIVALFHLNGCHTERLAHRCPDFTWFEMRHQPHTTGDVLRAVK
jgi:hypothetical protein